MVTLDELLDNGTARADARRAGRQALTVLGGVLYRLGWVACKGCMLLLLMLGGLLFGAGWVARRLIWPALCWCGKAVRLGWQEGHRRGPA